jgi:hypothetical protein
MKNSVRWATAFHEAGHAVACSRCGIKVRTATIVPARGYHGKVEHAKVLRRMNLDVDISARGDRRIKDLVVILLAGMEAQRRYNPRSVRSHHDSRDRESAVALALKANGSADSATAYLRWLSIVTRDIVESSWPQIERVAKELFARGALDAEQISIAIRGPLRGRGILIPDNDEKGLSV